MSREEKAEAASETSLFGWKLPVKSGIGERNNPRMGDCKKAFNKFLKEAAKNINRFPSHILNIARVANAVQCHSLLSGHCDCNVFRFSIVRNVKNITNAARIFDGRKDMKKYWGWRFLKPNVIFLNVLVPMNQVLYIANKAETELKVRMADLWLNCPTLKSPTPLTQFFIHCHI